MVREIKKDGSYGPIYFIYYNHGFNEKNTDLANNKIRQAISMAIDRDDLANNNFKRWF